MIKCSSGGGKWARMKDGGLGKHLLALQLCTSVTHLGSRARACLWHARVKMNGRQRQVTSPYCTTWQRILITHTNNNNNKINK